MTFILLCNLEKLLLLVVDLKRTTILKKCQSIILQLIVYIINYVVRFEIEVI